MASNGGSGPAFCVRSCDGRYFPLTRGNATPVQMCQAFCPASPTKVFYGSTIDNAASSSGERYADSENAFAYRKALRADCTCNGRDPAGLAPVDLTLDTSLRPGDVIATTDGLVAYSGVKVGVNQTAEFTPVASYPGLTPEVRARLGEMKVAPVSAETLAEQAPLPEANTLTRVGGAEDLIGKRPSAPKPSSLPLSPDNDADDVRRRQVFFLDLRARRGAVFRRQQSALLRKDHPAIAPPIRQHAVVIDQVVTLPGGKDAGMGFVERIEPGVIVDGKQIVAEIVRRVAPDRHADGVEFAVDLVVVDRPATRRPMQPRQRAREVGDAGECELIEGNGGHVVLASSERP